MACFKKKYFPLKRFDVNLICLDFFFQPVEALVPSEQLGRHSFEDIAEDCSDVNGGFLEKGGGRKGK